MTCSVFHFTSCSLFARIGQNKHDWTSATFDEVKCTGKRKGAFGVEMDQRWYSSLIDSFPLFMETFVSWQSAKRNKWEKESNCVCVCMWVRERERKRMFKVAMSRQASGRWPLLSVSLVHSFVPNLLSASFALYVIRHEKWHQLPACLSVTYTQTHRWMERTIEHCYSSIQ